MLVTDRMRVWRTVDPARLPSQMKMLVRAVERAVEGGVNAVQVREKDLPVPEQEALARSIVEAVGARAFVTVNAAPAIAMSAGACGVHGGEESPGVEETRAAAQGRLLVGRSVHDVAGAVAATEAGADYLVLGTIFPSNSHPGGPTGGLKRVREVTAAVRVPVIAIGGIAADNVAEVIRAGAAGVAVISAILGQMYERPRAAELRAALDAAWAEAWPKRKVTSGQGLR